MNAHERCLLLVAARVDFELERDEQHDVDRHLATCSTCPRQASLIVADATRIARLPVPQRHPASVERPPVRAVAGRLGLTPLRLVAIAALLALLALGALAAGGELSRRLEAPRDLAVAVTPGPTADARPSNDRSPATERSSDPAVAPSATSSGPPPCAAAASVEQLSANGGAWGLRCFGSTNLELVGYIPVGDGSTVCPGWEPQWLSCPSGTFIAARAGGDAPLLAYAHNGDVPLDRPSVSPDSPGGQPVGGRFARFTGHFGDPAAAGCQAISADAEFFGDRASLQRRCRETFVVTTMALLTGTDVPRPVVDASWTLAAGPAALGAPSSTTLRSIVEFDGQWFLLGFDDQQATSYLWSSADARTWQPVATNGYRLTGLADGGDRLFGIGGGDVVEVRTSTDGRTWTPVPGLPSNAEVATVAATSQGVFAGGGMGIDAAVWRFDQDFWNPVELPDAKGVSGGQDAAPAFIRGITELAGRLSAYGDGPPPGGVGFGVARLWESKDGVTWGAAPLPAAAGASALAGRSRSDGAGAVIVGSRLSAVGPASWATNGAEWTSGAFPAAGQAPTASLQEMVEFRGALIAIGLAPTRTDSLNVVVWGSSDGITWWPLNAGDMSGGLVNDVIAGADGRILAVGWQPTAAAGASGPAVWELVPTARP